MTPSETGSPGGGSGPAGVAIPAAGVGVRMGGRKKAFVELRGAPLLHRTLRPFLAHPDIVSIGIALPEADLENPPGWLLDPEGRIRLVAGGETRLLSVSAALDALDPEVEIALVHDAARPFVTREIIDRCIAVAATGCGGVAGWPSVDTLKEVGPEGEVRSTPDRSVLWRAQTPQAFPRGPLVEAYRAAVARGVDATDDSALFAANGGRVRMVEGSAWNLKITHPEDLAVAECLLSRVDAPAFP